MKKTYIIPNTEVLLLSTQQMMAASPTEPNVTIGSDNKDMSEFDTRRQHHGIGGGLWEDMK